MSKLDLHLAAAGIVQAAGGELIGRTRFQKITFLMQMAGFESNFSFEYRHYGPFSEELAHSIEIASALGTVHEEEHIAGWGGRYSIYTSNQPTREIDPIKKDFIQEAKGIDAVELELAATAVYLSEYEGIGVLTSENPWHETRRRKPRKSSNGRLDRAYEAYERLRKISTPSPLPQLPKP